jgi:hypothetical protein
MTRSLSPRVLVLREDRGWRAEIPDLRQLHRARTLYTLDRRIRELLGPGWVDYRFRTGDPLLDELVAGVRTGRRAAQLAEEQARELTDRVLDRTAGLSSRDLGVLLDLSHQRIHQLLKRSDPAEEGLA